MITGSCLCYTVTYQTKKLLGPIVCCHCSYVVADWILFVPWTMTILIILTGVCQRNHRFLTYRLPKKLRHRLFSVKFLLVNVEDFQNLIWCR